MCWTHRCGGGADNFHRCVGLAPQPALLICTTVRWSVKAPAATAHIHRQPCLAVVSLIGRAGELCCGDDSTPAQQKRRRCFHQPDGPGKGEGGGRQNTATAIAHVRPFFLPGPVGMNAAVISVSAEAGVFSRVRSRAEREERRRMGGVGRTLTAATAEEGNAVGMICDDEMRWVVSGGRRGEQGLFRKECDLIQARRACLEFVPPAPVRCTFSVKVQAVPFAVWFAD